MSTKPPAVQRLCARTAPATAGVPASRTFGPSTPVGMVHLGIGAFHRAHQAVWTQEAVAADGGDPDAWGICGVSQRSRSVIDQLRPQDGLYGVLERGPDSARLGLVTQVRDVLDAGAEASRLRDRLADPRVRVITLTVTEKGYRRGPDGRLDLTDPGVRADLESFGSGADPVTVVGRLARGLDARRVEGAPVTVLSCDNLVGNGHVLRGLVADLCAALPTGTGDPLAAFVEEAVRFPCSMVDRIVPATTEADRADAQALLGLRDEALVVAEPFRQWVIEDDFAAGRPAWERAGAGLVADVEPYEHLKLRVLNGTHSLLAYLGALAGYETISAAVGDPALADAAWRLVVDDVVPTLDPPAGVDVEAYARTVLDRYANPALRHRTTQIAMDGTQKLPVRLLGTVRDGLAAGRTPHAAIRGVAAWMVYVATAVEADGGSRLPLEDPLADELRRRVAGCGAGKQLRAAVLVDRLLALDQVFAPDLRDDPRLREDLVEQVAEVAAGAKVG